MRVVLIFHLTLTVLVLVLGREASPQTCLFIGFDEQIDLTIDEMLVLLGLIDGQYANFEALDDPLEKAIISPSADRLLTSLRRR